MEENTYVINLYFRMVKIKEMLYRHRSLTLNSIIRKTIENRMGLGLKLNGRSGSGMSRRCKSIGQ
jgi:hypothetical protein